MRTDSGTHTITRYTIGAGEPFGIATGGDGNLWFSESTAPAISIISSTGTNYTKYALSGWANPFAVTIGPDGNVWVGDGNSTKIARVTPAGVVTTYNAVTAFANSGTAGLDGSVWFAECEGNIVAGVSTMTGGAIGVIQL